MIIYSLMRMGKKILHLGGFVCIFVYGVLVGRYEWFPYQYISYVKPQLLLLDFKEKYFEEGVGNAPFQGEHVGEYSLPEELFKHAFTDPIIDGKLLYDAIESFEDVRKINQSIFIDADGFESAYEQINVLGAEQLSREISDDPVVKVSFNYKGASYSSYAYGKLTENCGNRKQCATLALVGSGLNVSKSTYTGDIHPTYGYVVGERSIYEALSVLKNNAIFVFIKPNEDFLAWHDGNGRKLNINFVAPYHLNLGGSYSVSHLIQSMAFTKWMKSCYRQTIVAGLSSGGSAAVMVSLQAEPTISIVSSGYSVISNKIKWSSITGLLGVPGFGDLDAKNKIKKMLKKSPTNWLFTWGKEEIGVYKIEAEEKTTANVIGGLPNVSAVIHDGGHVFPVDEVQIFLERQKNSGTLPK